EISNNLYAPEVAPIRKRKEKTKRLRPLGMKLWKIMKRRLRNKKKNKFMTTLQEYLDQTYPTKQEKERVGVIYFTDISPKKREKIAENRIPEVRIDGSYLKTPLTKLKFKNLPNPELMKILNIYNNNIQPTDIEVFSKFVNLTCLKIGTEKEVFRNGKHNKFYGSLKSYKNLTKLERICIEATDVDSGLEHLPMSLAKSTAKRAIENEEGGYLFIECSPHDALLAAIKPEASPK
ncbi:1531_t:CDS:2, partial [Racocetra persica]